jgi:deuterolysin
VQRTGLKETAFVPLKAGESYTTEINAATVHDLSDGVHTFSASGAIPYAKAGSTTLTGKAIAFKSNILTTTVDGAAARKVKKAVDFVKRTTLDDDCTDDQRAATLAALDSCSSLASAASEAASSGDADKFEEYFKTTDASTRDTVAARLSAVADECSSSTGGATTSHCTDTQNYCEDNVLAYTLPSENFVVNCPLYYSDLPGLTSDCHAQDQATTTLHEFTHAPGVYSPGTEDNGYGYAAATALDSADAVGNADSYALYANAIYAGC